MGLETKVKLQPYNGLQGEKRDVSPNILQLCQATYSGSCGDAIKRIQAIYNDDSGRIRCGDAVARW